jgi:hypothetical protein
MKKELETKISVSLVKAGELIVSDQESLSKANEFLLGIKQLRKEIEEVFGPIIEAAYKAHKEALAQKKKFEEPLLKAEQIVKQKIAGYLEEMERIRKQQEEERRRLEEEKKRIEEETLKRLAEAKEDSEMENAIKVAEEKLAKIPEIDVVEKPHTVGLSMREVWKFEIIDESVIPREFLIPDLAKIGKVVQTLKSETRIPGIRVYSEKVLNARIPTARI